MNVNFDLALTAAVMLHAGALTSRQLDESWLHANLDGVRRWRQRIHVTHDPALTMKLLRSVYQIESGREAIRALHARDIAGLVLRYRREYRSSLLSPAEAVGWLQIAYAALAKRLPPLPASEIGGRSAVPLYFAGRASLGFTNGTTDTVEIDLPVGSFSAAGVEEELRRKFLQEAGPRLGERTEAAFAAGLRMEPMPVANLVQMLIPNASPCYRNSPWR